MEKLDLGLKRNGVSYELDEAEADIIRFLQKKSYSSETLMVLLDSIDNKNTLFKKLRKLRKLGIIQKATQHKEIVYWKLRGDYHDL